MRNRVDYGIYLVPLLGVILLVPAVAAQDKTEYTALVEQIASGDEDEAEEATVELIARVADPLAEALGAIEQRPLEQQRRLRAALTRLTAVVRLRLYRAGLPATDKKLFDEFFARNEELVVMLFEDDPRRRLAALHQIPLEPNSGAGVLLVAKLYDWDVDVLEAALSATRSLLDEVVVRGLQRYITETTTMVCSGQLGPVERDLAIVYTDLTRLAIRQLGAAGAKDGIPTIIAAIQCFDQPAYRRFFCVEQALEALGRIGDERAVSILREHLNNPRLHMARGIGPGRLVRQTVGDAALLALAKIYELSPTTLGFYVDTSARPIIGFTDEQSRTDALSAFRVWYEQNADKSHEQRAPLTTRPALDERGSTKP